MAFPFGAAPKSQATQHSCLPSRLLGPPAKKVAAQPGRHSASRAGEAPHLPCAQPLLHTCYAGLHSSRLQCTPGSNSGELPNSLASGVSVVNGHRTNCNVVPECDGQIESGRIASLQNLPRLVEELIQGQAQLQHTLSTLSSRLDLFCSVPPVSSASNPVAQGAQAPGAHPPPGQHDARVPPVPPPPPARVALSRVNMPTPTTQSSRRMCVFVDAPIAVMHVQMHVARVFALLIAPADVVHGMSAWQMPLLRPLCSRPAPVDGRVVRVLLPLPVEQASVLPTASARVVLAHKGPRAIAARRCPRLHQPKRAAVTIATLKLDPIVIQATARSTVIAEAARAGHGCTLSLRNLLIVTYRRVDACVAMTTVVQSKCRTGFCPQHCARYASTSCPCHDAPLARRCRRHGCAGLVADACRTGYSTVKHTVSVLGAAVSRIVVLGTRGPPPLSRPLCGAISLRCVPACPIM